MDRVNFLPEQADFGFQIEFDRNASDPGRVFRALSKLVNFCETTDRHLLDALSLNIESNLVLESIEQGSIRIWLKNILRYKEEELRVFDFSAIKLYLVDAKAALINFTKERVSVRSKSELIPLQDQFKELVDSTHLNLLDNTPPSTSKLLSSIDEFQAANAELQSSDRLYYLTRHKKLSTNPKFKLSPEDKEKLSLEGSEELEIEVILKVKKADYLGESQWEFMYRNKKIVAKVNDLDWLNAFRQREFTIASGDAIKAKVKVITEHNSKDILVQKYSVEKVIGIIRSPEIHLSLFKKNEE